MYARSSVRSFASPEVFRNAKYHQLLSIFKVSRLLSVFPFDEKWEFSVLHGTISVVTSVIALSLFTYDAYLQLCQSFSFSNLMYAIRRGLVATLPLVHFSQVYYGRRKLKKSFQTLEECDRLMSRLGVSTQYCSKWLLLSFLAQAVFAGVQHLLNIMTDKLSVMRGVYFPAVFYLSQLIELQFFYVLLVLRTLFSSLSAGASQAGRRREELEGFVTCHHLLVGVSEHIDSIFSLQMLLSLFYIYVGLLSISLSTIKAFLFFLKALNDSKHLGEAGLLVARTTTWVIYCFLHFQFVAYYSVSLSKEVKKVNVCLYSTMLHSKSKDIMTSVAASVSVFLVIISQFDT